MNARTYISQLLMILLPAFVALQPHAVVCATATTPSLLYGKYKPAQLLGVTDTTVSVVGAAWWGAVGTWLFTATPASMPMVALTSPGSKLEATCAIAASTVGVQFLGDLNDGWAKILVDGEPHWQGNIQGNTLVYDDYSEIAGLPLGTHLIQVETMMTPGTVQVGHVTVVTFGCGARSTASDLERNIEHSRIAADEQNAPAQKLYLPAILS